MKLIINNLVIILVTIILTNYLFSVCGSAVNSKYRSKRNRPYHRSSKSDAFSSSQANKSAENNSNSNTTDIDIFCDESRTKLIGGGKLIKITENRKCKNNFIGLKQHPRNKQYYYICQPDRILLGRCENSTIYSDTYKCCVSKVNRETTPAVYDEPKHKFNVSKCCESGIFPIEGKIHYYYTCVYLHGRFIQKIRKCPRGSIFNSNTGTCVEQVNCAALMKTQDSAERFKPASEVIRPRKYVNSNGYLPCDTPGAYSTDDNPNYYYKCCGNRDGEYFKTKLKCPSGKSFDSSSEECVTNSEFFTKFPQNSIGKLRQHKKQDLMNNLPRLLTAQSKRTAKQAEFFDAADSDKTEEETTKPLVNKKFCGCVGVNEYAHKKKNTDSFQLQNTKEIEKIDGILERQQNRVKYGSDYKNGYADLSRQDKSYRSGIECISNKNSYNNRSPTNVRSKHHCHCKFRPKNSPITSTVKCKSENKRTESKPTVDNSTTPALVELNSTISKKIPPILILSPLKTSVLTEKEAVLSTSQDATSAEDSTSSHINAMTKPEGQTTIISNDTEPNAAESNTIVTIMKSPLISNLNSNELSFQKSSSKEEVPSEVTLMPIKSSVPITNIATTSTPIPTNLNLAETDSSTLDSTSEENDMSSIMLSAEESAILIPISTSSEVSHINNAGLSSKYNTDMENPTTLDPLTTQMTTNKITIEESISTTDPTPFLVATPIPSISEESDSSSANSALSEQSNFNRFTTTSVTGSYSFDTKPAEELTSTTPPPSEDNMITETPNPTTWTPNTTPQIQMAIKIPIPHVSEEFNSTGIAASPLSQSSVNSPKLDTTTPIPTTALSEQSNINSFTTTLVTQSDSLDTKLAEELTSTTPPSSEDNIITKTPNPTTWTEEFNSTGIAASPLSTSSVNSPKPDTKTSIPTTTLSEDSNINSFTTTSVTRSYSLETALAKELTSTKPPSSEDNMITNTPNPTTWTPYITPQIQMATNKATITDDMSWSTISSVPTTTPIPQATTTPLFRISVESSETQAPTPKKLLTDSKSQKALDNAKSLLILPQEESNVPSIITTSTIQPGTKGVIPSSIEPTFSQTTPPTSNKTTLEEISTNITSKETDSTLDPLSKMTPQAIINSYFTTASGQSNTGSTANPELPIADLTSTPHPFISKTADATTATTESLLTIYNPSSSIDIEQEATTKSPTAESNEFATTSMEGLTTPEITTHEGIEKQMESDSVKTNDKNIDRNLVDNENHEYALELSSSLSKNNESDGLTNQRTQEKDKIETFELMSFDAKDFDLIPEESKDNKFVETQSKDDKKLPEITGSSIIDNHEPQGVSKATEDQVTKQITSKNVEAIKSKEMDSSKSNLSNVSDRVIQPESENTLGRNKSIENETINAEHLKIFQPFENQNNTVDESQKNNSENPNLNEYDHVKEIVKPNSSAQNKTVDNAAVGEQSASKPNAEQNDSPSKLLNEGKSQPHDKIKDDDLSNETVSNETYQMKPEASNDSPVTVKIEENRNKADDPKVDSVNLNTNDQTPQKKIDFNENFELLSNKSDVPFEDTTKTKDSNILADNMSKENKTSSKSGSLSSKNSELNTSNKIETNNPEDSTKSDLKIIHGSEITSSGKENSTTSNLNNSDYLQILQPSKKQQNATEENQYIEKPNESNFGKNNKSEDDLANDSDKSKASAAEQNVSPSEIKAQSQIASIKNTDAKKPKVTTNNGDKLNSSEHLQNLKPSEKQNNAAEDKNDNENPNESKTDTQIKTIGNTKASNEFKLSDKDKPQPHDQIKKDNASNETVIPEASNDSPITVKIDENRNKPDDFKVDSVNSNTNDQSPPKKTDINENFDLLSNKSVVPFEDTTKDKDSDLLADNMRKENKSSSKTKSLSSKNSELITSNKIETSNPEDSTKNDRKITEESEITSNGKENSTKDNLNSSDYVQIFQPSKKQKNASEDKKYIEKPNESNLGKDNKSEGDLANDSDKSEASAQNKTVDKFTEGKQSTIQTTAEQNVSPSKSSDKIKLQQANTSDKRVGPTEDSSKDKNSDLLADIPKENKLNTTQSDRDRKLPESTVSLLIDNKERQEVSKATVDYSVPDKLTTQNASMKNTDAKKSKERTNNEDELNSSEHLQNLKSSEKQNNATEDNNGNKKPNESKIGTQNKTIGNTKTRNQSASRPSAKQNVGPPNSSNKSESQPDDKTKDVDLLNANLVPEATNASPVTIKIDSSPLTAQLNEDGCLISAPDEIPFNPCCPNIACDTQSVDDQCKVSSDSNAYLDKLLENFDDLSKYIFQARKAMMAAVA